MITDMYVIEKNLPLPLPRKTYQKYPFAVMMPGDSFIEPDLDWAQHVRSAASYYNSGTKRFVVQTSDEGVRVWRAA